MIIEILEDAIIDVLKLLPFLFVTYLIMEYIEHKMSEKTKKTIQKSGKWGPLLGGLVGIIPQCGFSASATNLYAARVISFGTLISVYLSTSDEMIPIFISEKIPISTLIRILAIKFLVGIIAGFIIDFLLRKRQKIKNNNEIKEETENSKNKENKDGQAHETENEICHFCEHEHCNCDKNGIFKSAVKHTCNILIYIFLITIVIDFLVEFIGEENIANFVGSNEILGPVFSSLIGLIPNCAASVIITNLYVQGIINEASLIAGLLTGAGIGLVVLFKVNKNLKENIKIVALIYCIGVFVGILL